MARNPKSSLVIPGVASLRLAHLSVGADGGAAGVGGHARKPPGEQSSPISGEARLVRFATPGIPGSRSSLRHPSYRHGPGHKFLALLSGRSWDACIWPTQTLPRRARPKESRPQTWLYSAGIGAGHRSWGGAIGKRAFGLCRRRSTAEHTGTTTGPRTLHPTHPARRQALPCPGRS